MIILYPLEYLVRKTFVGRKVIETDLRTDE